MKFFSKALNSALKVSGLNEAQLANEAGLEPTQISHYCRGLILPETVLLNQILVHFDKVVRLTLITAYLQDYVPPEVAEAIQIKNDGHHHVELQVSAALISELPEHIQNAICSLLSKNSLPESESNSTEDTAAETHNPRY